MKSSMLGAEHVETLSARAWLAWAHFSLGTHSHALTGRLFENIIRDMQSVLGHEHEETLSCLSGLASILCHTDKPNAFSFFEDVIARQKRVLGKDHPETLCSVNNLAWQRYRQEEFYEAYHLYKTAVEGQRDVLGRDHPDAITSFFGLACVYSKIGKQDLAASMFAEVAELNIRVYGKNYLQLSGA